MTSESDMICTKEEFDKLIIENEKFPYSIVNKEFSKYPWEIKKELNSAAMEGMIYAATKYDPKRSGECKFISYAVHWIRYYINEEIRKLYPVKFNQNFVCKRKKVNTCIKKYKDLHEGAEPTIEYISGQVGMSEKVVQNILNVNGGENFQILSFNMPSSIDDSESESMNMDKLVKEYLDSEAISYDEQSSVELSDLLDELKKSVPRQDYEIFYDYYINGENFSDLAKKYGLKFPSSASYLIKKCEKKCKELLSDVE